MANFVRTKKMSEENETEFNSRPIPKSQFMSGSRCTGHFTGVRCPKTGENNEERLFPIALETGREAGGAGRWSIPRRNGSLPLRRASFSAALIHRPRLRDWQLFLATVA